MIPNGSGSSFCSFVPCSQLLWQARRSNPALLPSDMSPPHTALWHGQQEYCSPVPDLPGPVTSKSCSSLWWESEVTKMQLWLLCQWALDNYTAPLREGRKGRIRVRGSVSAVSLNWLCVSVGKHKEDLEGCRWEDFNFSFLLLLHVCTEIRKSPAAIFSWVKACFSLLPPCHSAFVSMAGRTHTVSGEESGRGIQANLSQRNCTFFWCKISHAAPDIFSLLKGL